MSTVMRSRFNLALPLQLAAARRSHLHRIALTVLTILVTYLVCPTGQALAQQKKPNILVVWGDDIGWYNVSAYNMGVMA